MTFIDTNVLVYYVDERYPEKCRIATGIVASAIDNTNCLISAQVLNEFANVAICFSLQHPRTVATRS